jgi:hypothetical protein
MMRAASAELGLHADSMNFNTQNGEWITVRVIIRMMLRAYVYIHHAQCRFTDENGKIL